MRKLFLFNIIVLCGLSLFAQQEDYTKRFEHFNESRGDFESGLIMTLPYQETVRLYNTLQTNSGLGATFNYYGTVVIVDQMEMRSNGNIHLILRREDGNNFYGYRPTLKAVLSPYQIVNNKSNNNLKSI